MRPLLLGVLLLGSILVLAPRAAAQDEEPAITIDTSGGTWILSEPMGALVTLGGTSRVSGRTPLRLDERIKGTYAIKADYPGYDSWSGDILVDSSRGEQYTLTLNPKKRRKALIRSLLIPGWGQAYAGKKGKATAFFLTEAVTLIGLWFINQEYQDRVDDWEKAKEAYLDETYQENIPARRRELQRQLNRVNDVYDWQKGFNTAAIGIAALNIFDILFITPVGPVSGRMTISPMQSALDPGGIDSPRITAAVTRSF